jgi:drug/metabolite transporter (DMT)-like permease
MPPTNNRRGIAAMLAASCFFIANDTLLKLAATGYPASQLMALRGLFAVAVALAIVMARRQLGDVRKLLRRPVLARAGLEAGVAFLFITSLAHLPLANITAITQSTPIIMTLLTVLLGIERVGWRRWSAILIGFCGVLIALRPSSQTVSWPAMIALGGSISFALLMLITRSLRATPDIVLASSQFAGTFALGALISPFGWVTPGLGSLGLFAAAGCVSVSALLCVNRSLKLAPASVVVPYQYSMIVWAIIFGYLVFGDVPSIPTVAGAAIIIGAGFYIFLRERHLGRGEAVVNPPV